MAGAACKVILNGAYPRFAKDLETALFMAREKSLIKEERAKELIQLMADVDIEAYERLVCAVAKPLEAAGVLSEDVWRIYRDPTK